MMSHAHQKISREILQNVAIPINILLVEDNKSDAAYTKIMLDYTDIPYTLEQINKGKDVLPHLIHKDRIVGEEIPDLILLDLGLPCQDGFEVLNDLTQMNGNIRSIPIAIITAYENFAYLKNTHSLYIFDYITKPCSSEKLRRILLNSIRYRH